ncbi:MAG TPA: amino acid adenylation domain-containing protein, partial [Streptosporangiaceae bacterium]|nr:amino acid adenylation domain-containing protein [Streptosporangiaceae bacterium]
MVVKDDSPIQTCEAEFSSGLIGELFAAQAARTPHAPAVIFDGGQLRYAELEAAANRLAGRLAGLGVGREDRVGVLAERSAEQVIAVLAVVKAGAAYLPLDTRAPAERMRLLLAEAGARAVLCDQAWHDTAAGLGQGRSLLVDAAELLTGGPAAPPPVTADPEDLAYVISTSGSTGQPKAVAVRHQDVAALAADHRFSGAHQRVLLHSPLAFDASTYELWVPLLAGGQVVIAPPGDLDPGTLRRMITEHRVTALWLTSGLFRIIAQDAPDALAGAQEVWTGGDVVPAQAVRRVLAACPGLTVVDGYGPTETTTFATCHPMPAPGAVPDVVPIGRPLDNMQVYVLDPDLRPVPPGIPGQLYIAGAGLARGYLNQPGLTAQRFIACPSGPPGRRMYATGDLARWTGDGQLEFTGRADQQVKIRGFRIEPGEIETVLCQHSAIADAAVIAREDIPGRKYLAAYLVPATCSPPAADLRAHLAAALPDYMIPAAFVTVDALPLTRNGKLDRHALPVPTWSSATDGDYTAPRTQSERVITRICGDVLGLDRIGIHDNFFELGGDSILSIDLVFRIGETFGVRLPARTVFDAPTAARLAEFLPAQAHPSEGDDRIAPAPGTGTRAVPLSAAQRRLWFLDDLTSGGIEYNTGIGVRLSGRLDTGALREALDALASRHESLRTTFDTADGRGMQVVAAEGDIPLSVLDMSAIHDDLRDAAVERTLANELKLPFDLRRGPLTRVTLLRLAENDHIALLCQHHIITDGWSVKVLVDELAELYSASVRGSAAILPELPIQYADFALWQGGQLAGPALDAHLDYWDRKLAGLEPLELPTDRPRPPVRTTAGAVSRHGLPADLVERLTKTGQSRSATLFMTLTAAVQLLLSRYSGQRDVAIGTATSGRTRAELKDLVGFFVNTVVLRSQVDDTTTVGQFLSQVRETALEAFAHEEAPFDRVVERLKPERDPGSTPLFQAMIVLQNAIVRPRTASGLRFSPHDLPRPAAQFDLVFEFIPRDGSLNLAIEYNTDLFDTATVERMAGHLQVLLAAIAADPGRLVGGIELATPAERAQVLGAGAGPASVVPAGTFPELFQAQAARTPGATALVAGAARLSYGELNIRANQLARHLAAAGAGPERLIALALPRTAEMVIAILAVLKAGAAYLPVDPALPAGRISQLLTDAQPILVITTAAAGLPGSTTATPRLLLDDPGTAAAVAGQPGTDLTDADRAAPLHPAHPAYVIYTSGSTGTPKGVVVPHTGLVNLHTAQRQGFLARAGRQRLRAALTASFSFDPSWEGLLLLASGHELHLIDEQVRMDPAALVQYTADQRIDLVNSTPSYLDQLLAAGLLTRQQHRPAIILTAGEPVPGHLWQALAAAAGTASYNLYGPTETTVEATSCLVTGTRPAIGRPLDNMRVYVLDPDLRVMPPGIAGQLYIAGAGLARGYLGRPGLTAQKFTACPFG